MHHIATKVRFLEDVVVECTFEDGKIYQYDMSKMFKKYPQLEELRTNRKLFLSGRLSYGGFSVIWNDELDFDASSIYECGVLVGKFDVPLAKNVGVVLGGAREDALITQEDLAKLTGINQGDISRIEKGTGNPTLKKIEKILNALGKTMVITLQDKKE